jgi:DNA-binding IclR family transcriptional regulator
MEELVRSWGETVHLAVLDGVQAVYVEKLQPKPAVKIYLSRTGARLPAHCSGVGKVLLASSEWDHVAALFEDQGMPGLTPNTITTLDLLHKELGRVREQGYALDDEETLIGLCCVAAPICDSAGKTVAAVSISAPSYRFHTKKKDYTDAVLDTARRISESARPKAKEFPDYRM